jgi:hypothetical protein
MKFIFSFQIIVATFFAFACAAPQQRPDEPIAIISQNSNLEPDGSYQSR